MATDTTSALKIYALINYEDPYVQPLILAALQKHLPPSAYHFITSVKDLPSASSPLLQFMQYESLDFEHLLSHPTTSLANAYVIRKALIRKHFLSTMVANWIVKYPDSVLKRHVKPSVAFEVDYAEFLDDALVEAWELKESWARGEAGGDGEKEWWILKPGMSERGQGIRLFSSEEELVGIFEGWDSESEEEDDDDEREEADARSNADEPCLPTTTTTNPAKPPTEKDNNKGIITSQLRHFIAQPYIHPPLLLHPPSSSPPSQDPTSLRKFHIRTYILATGALKIYIYKPMLALFAARPYTSPSASTFNSGGGDDDEEEGLDEALKAHLTNTCLQDTGEREGSVGLFWDLPDTLPPQPSFPFTHSSAITTTTAPLSVPTWKSQTFAQICSITGELFEAAARGMSVYFQPLPNSFEVFGLDFMVSVEQGGGSGGAEVRTWLLEVNAFPDFRQSGERLKGVVGGLFEGVVRMGVAPFFGIDGGGDGQEGEGEDGDGDGGDMVKVLDIDLGRR
ncbi:tubulin-tyrosine ligase [Byssothecium circinans]|uniref:Tubulin-tyrosine ligase n=1 Tax=Byssothecium circinans TaxID=147558 RepID=A0A6A5U3Q1_9PLEO|nr:tubulin-tyrosine ligase [Byssothecium circinans]